MITQKIEGSIKLIKRLNNSVCGNPNYKIVLNTKNNRLEGYDIVITTLNDAMVNYSIYGGMEGKHAIIEVKVNKYSNKLLNIEV